MEEKLQILIEKGVVIPDPRQVYIADEVDLDRVMPGSVLYPGTRLVGSRTFIGSGAKIGTDGPAVISDTIMGPNSEIASGYIDGATLLSGAKAGANSHYRAGTLLEEEASTAHCVGLKQSILMYAVTLGSLINLCDVLISGGHSRKEHTEIGSGFIHFNFTPWGANGDKATASMAGNVTEGVFLDQPRIFFGGMSGMVGPNTVGFGAMTVAGQVIRHPVENETMHADVVHPFDKPWSATNVTFSEERLNRIKSKNVEYLAQLYALKKWYRQVRLVRSNYQKDAELSLVYEGALDTIDSCVKERLKRYNSLAKEWGMSPLNKEDMEMEFSPMSFEIDWRPELPYDEWIWQLGAEEKEQLHSWLTEDTAKVRDKLEGECAE